MEDSKKDDLFLLEENSLECLLDVRLRGVDCMLRLFNNNDDDDESVLDLLFFLVFFILLRFFLFDPLTESSLKRYSSAYRIFSLLVPFSFSLDTMSSACLPCQSTTKFCRIESSIEALVWLFESASGYR